MDSKTLTSGCAKLLSQSPGLVQQPWKLKGSKLVLKQAPTELTLVLKKQSLRTMEPWMRVGMYVLVELDLRRADLATILGVPERTVLVRGGIGPMGGGGWHTTEQSPEPLGREMVEHLEPILPELVRVLQHPAGLESICRRELESRRHPGRVNVALPAGLRHVGTKQVGFRGALNQPAQLYIAALLARGQWREARAWLQEAGADDQSSWVGNKSYPIWTQLTAQADAIEAKGEAITPLPPADWNFEAIEASIKEQRLADSAPQNSPGPISELAPSDSRFERVKALLELPQTWSAFTLFYETMDAWRWRSAMTLMLREPLSSEQEAQLTELFEGLPLETRRWVKGMDAESASILWQSLRHASLPLSSKHPGHTVLSGGAFELAKVDPSTHPELQILETNKMVSHLELLKLTAALPELHSLSLNVPDAPLAAAIKEGALANIQSLKATDYKGFERSVKSLTKHAPALRELSLQKVGPAGAKSLAKGKLAGELRSLDISTSDKGWSELAALWDRFTNLEQLTLRSVTLSGMVLPTSVHTLTLNNLTTSGFDFNAQDLTLRRFALDSYSGDALQLAIDSASSIEALDLSLPWKAFRADLAEVDWPQLGSLTLSLSSFEGNEVAPLVAWLKRMPKLHSLKISVGLDASAELELVKAWSNLQALHIKSPNALETLATQTWPDLRALSVDLRRKDSIKVPLQDSFAQVMLQQMPALASFGASQEEDQLSEAVRAELDERFVML